MLQHVELDPSFRLEQQYADASDEPMILLNLFDVALPDRAAFKEAWRRDSEFFKRQPGYISAQLHQGLGDSRLFFNYAVFDTVAHFAATNRQPEFGPLRGGYPDSATAHPHLFRRVAVPGVCVNSYRR